MDEQKEMNEDVYHMFGYVDMSEEKEFSEKPNNTPFVNYEGKQKPENKAKFNYYKELNKLAFERRFKVPLNDIPGNKDKVKIGLGE